LNLRRIIGIVFVIGGIVLLGIAHYIRVQVEAGKIEIAEGEKKVDTARELFSLHPATKGIGEGITQSGERKIAEGKQEVVAYSRLANQLQIGGFILIALGIVIIVIPKRKK
jgi:hypothetical protein